MTIEAQREGPRATARRQPRKLTPKERADRSARSRTANARSAIDAALCRIDARRAHLSQAQRRKLRALADGDALTPPEDARKVLIMAALREHPPGASASDVAIWTGIPHSTTCRLLGVMEARGVIGWQRGGGSLRSIVRVIADGE